MTDIDWTDAYANRPYIEGAETYPPRWTSEAAAFRALMLSQNRCQLDIPYASGERNRLDIFWPDNALFAKPLGLVVFVHGGYWLQFDKSFWSHFASGCLEAGWALAMPSYSLAPGVRISNITLEVAAAITMASGLIEGPIHLAGHSAGGHLVTRMVCDDTSLIPAIQKRVKHVVSISGLHDLRPLMKTAMNAQLQLDAQEAAQESAALHRPVSGFSLTCYVGGDERPEFLRQNALLANIWHGLGVRCEAIVEESRHHFNILDGMRDRHSRLTKAITGAT